MKPKATVHVKPKPKKKVTHARPVVKAPVVPHVNVTPAVGAAVHKTLQRSSGGSSGFGAAVILFGLISAICCFSVALVPATSLKWRPGAIFVSERQVDVTVAGLGLLVTAAILWTKGI